MVLTYLFASLSPLDFWLLDMETHDYDNANDDLLKVGIPIGR
jgi:hypothetical protein